MILPKIDTIDSGGINSLKRELRSLFQNRHGSGYGYRDEGNIKEYKRCQRERRTHLFNVIECIRILNLVILK